MSISFITIRQILKLCSSLHGVNSNPSSVALFQRWPHSPLSADLFYDEIKCIQVQSSDVVAVIVWLIPIFGYN